MAEVNPTMPTPGDPRGQEELDLRSALATLIAEFNGNVDAENIPDNAITAALLEQAVRSQAGINLTGEKRSGYFGLDTTETTTSASYAYLTTPDVVEDIVLPTNGLIYVVYRAVWASSVSNAGRAAVFLNTDQLKHYDVTGAVTVSEVTSASAGIFGLLASTPGDGLGTVASISTAGLPMAARFGACIIEAAAGTYDVGVKFKCSSGNVGAGLRRLWVFSKGFS